MIGTETRSRRWLTRLVSVRFHFFVGGNLIVWAAEGFGGRLMRTVSFFRLLSGSLSSSPRRAATVGPRGGRGGGLLVCGFGFGFWSSDIISPLSANDHHQRCEPAAKGARIVNDMNGWLASAEWCS